MKKISFFTADINLAVKPFHIFILLVIFALAGSACASNIKVGQKLPALTISEGGELYFDELKQRQFRPWSTSQLLNKKHIIQYMPGRFSSRDNLPLNEAAFAIDHPHRCRTVSIINFTDALPGTWIFIEPEMARNKKITPLCDIILDKAGVGQVLWQVPLASNITIVVNEKSIVEFFWAGKLSQKQIEMIIDLTNPPGVKRPEKIIPKTKF